MPDENFNDLEIRIFAARDEGYPVEITLGEQQEFPRGYLVEDVVPWTSSGDLVIRCITPLAELGPYNAAPGPSDTSIRSRSRSLEGIML